MTDIDLKFVPNDGGEAEGLSDAGIETYRENPFAAVARETGQNSRDARDHQDKPVRLAFDVITLASKDFPSIESFRNAAEYCMEKSLKINNEKEIGFFKNAVNTLNAPEIRILRISDFNTIGVRGPCIEGKPFHTLAKSDGISTKQDVSSGGSFGIGKNAAFAVSDIQTVFISTLYKDNDSVDQALCMGITQFISHTDSNGNERRRKGYWGRVEGYLPIDKQEEIPSWLRRSEQGTSIFSICMRHNRTDWRYEMAAAILINFFCAIERQEMEFEIDNSTIKINKSTIEPLFNDEKIIRAVDQLNAGVVFNAAKNLYTCLIDMQKITENIDIENLGIIKIHMLLRDGLGYNVGIIRNGMYITDNLSYFNEQFKRFPLHRDFAVIIEPAGKTESEWFKRLENPRHDTLSAERITDPDLRSKGQQAFEKLAQEIRNKIRAFAKTEPSDTLDLDELSEFFASDETRKEDDKGTEKDPRSRIPTPIRPIKPEPPQTGFRGHGERNDPPGPGPEPGPRPSPGPGPRPGPGPVPHPRKKLKPIELEAERALIPDSSNLTRRRIIFTSPVTSVIILQTDASGLNNPERLKVVSVNQGIVNDDSIELSCNEGQRIALDVEFDSPYAGPVEISAFQVEEQVGESA